MVIGPFPLNRMSEDWWKLTEWGFSLKVGAISRVGPRIRKFPKNKKGR